MDSSRRQQRQLEEEEDRDLAWGLARDCFDFLGPLLKELDKKLDVRLVRTLADAVTAIVRHRNRPLALLLSELGAVIAGPKHGPAGTKRLANLIHSEKWKALLLQDYLLEEEGQIVMLEEAARVAEGRALCILDGSVLEKPESTKLEGLSPVRSAKAKRVARPRPKMGKGYYRGKPGGPIVVPGFEWTSALITGWASREERQPVALAAWHWYAKPVEGEVEEGSEVERQRGQEAARAVLDKVNAALGKDKLLHVWDRGFSGAPWLGEAIDEGLAFVVRWKKGNKLRPADAPSVGDQEASSYRQDQDGEVAWKLTRMKNWGSRQLANARHPGSPITVGFAAREVRLPHRDEPLWLVVARFGKGTKRRRGDTEPWRLLTNQPVRTEEECWRIVVAYGARWAIEQELRFGKSELGVESIRVQEWAPRSKLLAIASLAYAFLVHLLADATDDVLPGILRWAHRTGRQATDVWRSLYRLRAALSNLWNKHSPSFQGVP
jgi:Transposase DDE domain.